MHAPEVRSLRVLTGRSAKRRSALGGFSARDERMVLRRPERLGRLNVFYGIVLQGNVWRQTDSKNMQLNPIGPFLCRGNIYYIIFILNIFVCSYFPTNIDIREFIYLRVKVFQAIQRGHALVPCKSVIVKRKAFVHLTRKFSSWNHFYQYLARI